MYVGPLGTSHLTMSLSQNTFPKQREGKKKKGGMAQIEKLKLGTRPAACLVEMSSILRF